jgi:Na+-driven multidrug efflux pump
LRLGRFSFDGRALLQACTNGASELMSNLSMSLVNMLYNWQLLRYAGENGVAAYGVIMYVNLVFLSVFIGYSIGSAPLFGFNYGADNACELKNLFRKSMGILMISSVSMVALAVGLAGPLSGVFVGYDPRLMEMTQRGFVIYAFSFLFSGFNIFGSSMFTAFNNGLISALISFVRALICQVAAVMLLPLIWKLDGIWFSVVAAELVALCLTLSCFVIYRKRYKYA